MKADYTLLDRTSAATLDFLMSAMMNAMQWRHRIDSKDRENLERYLTDCAKMDRADYFRAPAVAEDVHPDDSVWRWRSPVQTPYDENNFVRVDLYPCHLGWSAPTVLLLHALGSTSDTGYRAWARSFHARGWNACFVHLPYHYSRTPAGHAQGELAITADLVRTGEGLRQGVSELRQLMARLRMRGCKEFALWATSYGGWIGSLLSFMEADFRWLALMSPIVNVEYSMWECFATARLRSHLRRAGIDPSYVARHAHLTSPRHGHPLCGGDHVLMAAGLFDQLVPASAVSEVAEKWGAEFLLVPQGHFGYRMMPAVFERLIARGWI